MRRGTANSFGLLVSVGRKSWQWIPEGWQNYQANIQSMWFHRFLEMTTAQQQLPLPFVSTVYGSSRRTMARSLPPQQVLPAECVHGRGQSQRPRHRAARGSREVHLPARLPLQVWHTYGDERLHYAPYYVLRYTMTGPLHNVCRCAPANTKSQWIRPVSDHEKEVEIEEKRTESQIEIRRCWEASCPT